MLKALVSTVFAVSLAVSGAAQTTKAGSGLDTARIEQLTGTKGKLDEMEGAFKVSVPRTDLAVTAAGIKLTKQEVGVLPLRIEFACFLQKRHSAVVFFAVVVDFSQTKAGRRVLRVRLKRFLKQQFGALRVSGFQRQQSHLLVGPVV